MDGSGPGPEPGDATLAAARASDPTGRTVGFV